MLDFRIKTFLMLCETKSYTNTAKLLHITQPSVTQHIKHLQNRFHCKLFIYEGKTLYLTPEGEYLRSHALDMTIRSSKIIEDMHRLGQKTRTLRLGCTKSLGETVVPHIVTELLRQNDKLSLALQIENTSNLLNLLEAGKVDFILADQAFMKNHFASYSIGTDCLCGWAAPELADQLGSIRVYHLLRERLLLREEGADSRTILEEWLEECGCNISDFYTMMCCNTSSSIHELTVSGMGICFDYASSMKDAVKQNQVKKLNLNGFPEERQLAFMYLKDSLFAESYLPFFEMFKEQWDADNM